MLIHSQTNRYYSIVKNIEKYYLKNLYEENFTSPKITKNLKFLVETSIQNNRPVNSSQSPKFTGLKNRQKILKYSTKAVEVTIF